MNDTDIYQKLGELIGKIEAQKSTNENLRKEIADLRLAVKEVDHKIEEQNIKWSRVGGGMIVISSIGVFIGWFLSGLLKIKGIFVNGAG